MQYTFIFFTMPVFCICLSIGMIAYLYRERKEMKGMKLTKG